MPDDRFAGNDLQPAAKPLTVFRAELLGSDQATWPELLAGFDELKAITFSSSLEFLLRLAGGFSDLEIVFGSESVLSREHLTLAQASQTVQAYGFVDALADQKALVEALARLLGRTGQALLNRVAAGSLRFRLLRGKPSHEKLYLLSGAMGQRVVTGSANLSLAAFEGRQHEIIVAFEGKAAWDEFDRYYERDWGCSLPVEPDALVTARADGSRSARETPLALEEVPIVRALKAGLALVDEAPRSVPAGFAAEALRAAAALGAELKELALPKDKAGRTVLNAASMLRVIRGHQGRPLVEAAEDRIPRADIDFSLGTVLMDGNPWLRADEVISPDDIARDARILVDYLDSFLSFFGNAAGAVEVYWAFLVWLYAAPAAPHLRQAAVPEGIDPWVYPVYAVLFGRSSGGKTLFTKIAARSMFGFEKMIRSRPARTRAGDGLLCRAPAPLVATTDAAVIEVSAFVRCRSHSLQRSAAPASPRLRQLSASRTALPQRRRECGRTRIVDVVERRGGDSGQVRPGAGDPTERDKNLLVRDRGDGVDHVGRGVFQKHPEQHRASLTAPHAAERASGCPRNSAVEVLEKVDQHRGDRVDDVRSRTRQMRRMGTHHRIRVTQQREALVGG
ncbi:MAG TPA: phospholipase D-like domain-containing protein [Candidatus Acidoferrum sp.]|nr:phospholipase D-like domain-containing protein [Candidatus Acidoferrum sp.]